MNNLPHLISYFESFKMMVSSCQTKQTTFDEWISKIEPDIRKLDNAPVAIKCLELLEEINKSGYYLTTEPSKAKSLVVPHIETLIKYLKDS
jgi:hypothetical protein